MTMMVCALKHIWSLSYWEKVVFQSIVGIEIFTNFFLNALIVFLIFKTKQYEKQSFKLLIVVSLSNCFTAIFGQGSLFLAFFDMFGDLPCVVQSLCQGLITWTCTFCFSVNFWLDWTVIYTFGIRLITSIFFQTSDLPLP